MALDVVLLLFFVLIGVSIRPSRVLNEQYISLSNTKNLRGILAVAIVFHHISEKSVDGGRLFPMMVHAGYLIVAVFFFLSGYGCLVSYKKKGWPYISCFWKNRILFLAVIYVFVIIAYVCYYRMMGRDVGWQCVLDSFKEGHPIAMNSWYVVVQLLLYVFFYITFIIPRIRIWIKIVIVFALVSFMPLIFDYWGYNSIWYISNYAFVFGLLYAEKKDLFDIFLRRRWISSLVITLFLFAFFSALPLVGDPKYLPSQTAEWAFSIRHTSRFLSSTAFVALLVVCVSRIRFVWGYWSKIGLLSMEIYLFHGMVYSFFRSEVCYIRQDAIWVLLTVIVSILLALPAHFLTKRISKIFHKI